jgi:hypothetical protein
LHGDCRAACPNSSVVRADRADNSTDTCSRSANDPNVAATGPAVAAVTASRQCRSVHAAGIKDLLPSGSTSSNSSRPWRRI